MDDYGTTTGRWLDVVRRARMGSGQRKLAALIMASYADTDGRSIYTGIHRLALDMEASPDTASRCLVWLRRVGLIERLAKGHWKRGTVDTYRLILGPDLLEHVEIPDPEEYRRMRLKAAAAQGDRRNRSRRGVSTAVDGLWTTVPHETAPVPSHESLGRHSCAVPTPP